MVELEKYNGLYDVSSHSLYTTFRNLYSVSQRSDILELIKAIENTKQVHTRTFSSFNAEY